MSVSNDFLGLALQTGGAGIGVTGLVYAVYVHFTNKMNKQEADRNAEKLLEAEHEKQATIKRLEHEKQKALESAERDKKIELANMQAQLNKQRLDTHGEFIDMLGRKIDKLTDSVSSLTADMKAEVALRKAKE